MRELSATEVDAVIEREGVGVLAFSEDDVPYALPMSYFSNDLQVWGERLEETDLTLYVLDVEERSGREFRT